MTITADAVKLSANLPKVESAPRDPAAQLDALRRKFEEIHAPSHPLRAALQKHILDHTRRPVPPNL